jgi:tetratricopeptide (TPR) repeat protein
VYLYDPQLITSLLQPKVPELALSHVATGYKDLDTDTNESIASAVVNFEKAVALAPEFPDAKAGLAEALIAGAEWKLEEARALRARADAAPDEEKEGLQKQTKDLRNAANEATERAFAVGKEALVLDPAGLGANRAMADYYRFKRAKEQMQPLIERALAAGPQDARVAYIMGSSLMNETTTLERAARYFDQALEANPGMQRARYKLAKAQHMMGHTDDAIKQVEALLAAVPTHERALALLQILRPPEPPPEPEPAPTEDKPKEEPMSFDKLVAQGDRLRGRDQPRKAMHFYEQALELEPEDPDALTGMGWCYYDLEMTDAAIRTFKQVIGKLPRFSDAHMGLAMAYEEKDMKRDAVKHYQKYLEIMPDGPEAPVARGAVQRLQ